LLVRLELLFVPTGFQPGRPGVSGNPVLRWQFWDGTNRRLLRELVGGPRQSALQHPGATARNFGLAESTVVPLAA
jgi:hypothetical protein